MSCLCSLQELLEVAVLAEDIGKCLFHDIIGAAMDESGILIDLRCGCIGEANRSTEMSGWMTSSNGIGILLR